MSEDHSREDSEFQDAEEHLDTLSTAPPTNKTSDNNNNDNNITPAEATTELASGISKKKKKNNKKKKNKANAQQGTDEAGDNDDDSGTTAKEENNTDQVVDSPETSDPVNNDAPTSTVEPAKASEEIQVGKADPHETPDDVKSGAESAVESPIGESTPLEQSSVLLQQESSILEQSIVDLRSSEEELSKDVPVTNDDDTKPLESDAKKPATPTKKDQPELPPRDNVASPAPALPSRDHIAAAVPQLPPRSPQSGGSESPVVGGIAIESNSPGNPPGVAFPPPPVPPQLTNAQKAHHRGSVLPAWLRGGLKSQSTSSTETVGASEKSVEIDDNYDLLLTRVNENTEDYMSKDETSKEQIDTSAKALRDTFAEKVHEIEESEASITADDSELNKIDWPFWTKVVNDYASVAKVEPSKLSKELSSGIPPQIRGIVWQLVANSNPKEFENTFSTLLTQESKFEKNIVKDLSRTTFIADYNLSQDSLYNIIKAYSIYDSEVGYTQGMAFITVPLLLNMNELESFSMLQKLMYTYDIRSLYLPEMPGLQLKLYQFDRLVEDLLPNLHTHLLRQGVRSSMYASQWFLTFFAYKFPLEFVLRIFDIIITEGYASILKFAIALLQQNEEKLISLKFDDLLEFLKENLFDYYSVHKAVVDEDEEEEPVSNIFSKKKSKPAQTITVDSYDVDKLVLDATDVKILPISLKRYSDEFQEIHREEKERQEEVDEVRLRNNQLRKEIRKIESSYTLLNREHVQIANELISGRMKVAELEDQNKELKSQNNNLRERIRGFQDQNAEVEVPVNLEEDLKKTMNRNLEVMNKNQELEEQVSDLLKQIEDLNLQLKAKTVEAEPPLEDSTEHHHHHSSHKSSSWTKKFFK